MDPIEELIQEIGATPDDARDILAGVSLRDYSEEELLPLVRFLMALPVAPGERQGLVDSVVDDRNVQPTAAIEAQAKQEEDRKTESDYVDANPRFDRDGDGEIDDTPEGRAAREELGVGGGYDSEEGAFIDAMGGTEEIALKKLEWITETWGLQQYDSISEFVKSEEWADATWRAEVIQLMGPPGDPKSKYEFDLPGGEVFSVRSEQVDGAVDVFGVTNPEELNFAVKAAWVNDVRDSQGRLNWQITAAFQTFAGHGFGEERDYRSESRKLLLEQSAVQKQIKELEPLPSHLRDNDRLRRLREEFQSYNDRLRNLAIDPGRILEPRRLTERYKQGMELYDSETTAFFHALDEGLAARMVSDPGNLSKEDARLTLNLLQQSGMKGEDATAFASNMFDVGFVDPMATALADAMAKASGGGGGGGTTRIRMRPDPVGVRQSAKDFYRQMFLEEPDDATLDRFSASVSSAIASASDDVEVDPNARIRDAAEKLPEYEEYYGNMPGGVTEEQYQGMHRAGQRSMLGEELAGNEPTRIGMRQGQYQTTVGAAAGTKEAWDNSTFLGRLARAAQAVSRNT